jgi:hypothetical protein
MTGWVVFSVHLLGIIPAGAIAWRRMVAERDERVRTTGWDLDVDGFYPVYIGVFWPLFTLVWLLIWLVLALSEVMRRLARVGR